jgi:hypothetical protein
MGIGCHLFYQYHFFDSGEVTSFQFVEIDTAWEIGGIKVNGVIACGFISGFKGFY